MAIKLEPISGEFESQMQALASDPEIHLKTYLPSPFPEDGARRFIQDCLDQKETRKAYAIVVDQKMVGCVGVYGIKDGQASLSYWIGKEYWGKGYATAAGEQMVREAFTTMNLDSLEACSILSNRASSHILEQLGFHLTSVTTGDACAKWANQEIAHFIQKKEIWEVGQGI